MTSEAIDCPCACCAHTAARLASVLPRDGWCNCPDYAEAERCDCAHCLSFTRDALFSEGGDDPFDSERVVRPSISEEAGGDDATS